MKLIIILIFSWIALSLTTNLNQVFLPNANKFLIVVIEELYSGELLSNILATFNRVISGLAIGLIIGLPAGLALGMSDFLRKEIMPLVEFFRSIPTSMLFPIYIVVFGIGELSKVVIVASTTFPIILINTIVGCMPRPETQDRRDYISIHSDKLPTYIKILAVTWDALPPIVAGLKVAISISLVLTIVTEMFFVASSGVGWAAHQAYLSFDLETMYCYVIVVGMIGLALNKSFDYTYQSFSQVLKKSKN